MSNILSNLFSIKPGHLLLVLNDETATFLIMAPTVQTFQFFFLIWFKYIPTNKIFIHNLFCKARPIDSKNILQMWLNVVGNIFCPHAILKESPNSRLQFLFASSMPAHLRFQLKLEYFSIQSDDASHIVNVACKKIVHIPLSWKLLHFYFLLSFLYYCGGGDSYWIKLLLS